MSPRLKNVIKLTVTLVVTIVIFWYLYKDIDIDLVWKELKGFNYNWIFVSIFLALISHTLRAWRWGLMLQLSGRTPRLKTSLYAVMIGYLANSVFPRLGEFTRCTVVNRKDNIPLAFAFGTVFTERLVDVFMLIVISIFTFVIQFNLLGTYITGFFESKALALQENWYWLVAGLIALGILLYFMLFKKPKNSSSLFHKVRSIFREIVIGAVSITKVKNQVGFWTSGVAIWVLYYLMMYTISFGSPTMNDLTISAGLAVLVMGSFGMAAPVQNGIGTFHAFVAGILVLYGIPETEGKIFALILHSSQFITVLVFGSISLILVNFTNKKPTTVEADKRQNINTGAA